MKIGNLVEIALEDGSVGEGRVISFDADTVCITQDDEDALGNEISTICYAEQKNVKVIPE